MTLSADPQRSIDKYLAALRRQLRDLMEDDVNDIVGEIRAHILDKTTAAGAEQVEQTLAALGTPAELASRYRTQELIKRAQAHRTGAQKASLVLRRIGALSAGLAAFAVSVVGYFSGAGLVVIAVAKVLWPRGTGLWLSQKDGTMWLSLSGGNGNTPPPDSRDLLGWWLAPIGLVLGTALIYGTYRFGSWVMRKLWRPRKWRYAPGEQQVES